MKPNLITNPADPNSDSSDTFSSIQKSLNSWSLWSTQEKQAILIDDWIQVALCQKQKDSISNNLTKIFESLNLEEKSKIKSLIQPLHEQQVEISDLIHSKVEGGQREIDKLDSSSKTLKKIHISYSSGISHNKLSLFG